ncbi:MULTISPECIES: hypothetical protein [Glycomyces]|uniref:Uncharacterized protein n=2 Tax=Glycomyces TaxID=58113 RepID=A0A9X3T8R6_9ACTN|nr:hypothetical protein [Glycomyces lechevalierae]MDA1385528.1 hypothetical protein [Glycomyces lechevalierae]MDR7339636.1 hypothetical protein [Glycomyces lechevalierae]
MRRILASAAAALAIGAAWAAPAAAGTVESEVPIQAAGDTESVYCSAAFSVDTVVREYPSASAGQIGPKIPAGTWVDGTWCSPFTDGGKHTTCGSWSKVWIVVNWADTWGFAHVGCLQGYYVD